MFKGFEKGFSQVWGIQFLINTQHVAIRTYPKCEINILKFTKKDQPWLKKLD